MSTTFDVYPTVHRIPSFRQLLDLADRHLEQFLHSYGLVRPVRLSVQLLDNESDELLPTDLSAPAWWPRAVYASFFVERGGYNTDAHTIDPADSYLEDLTGERSRI